MEIDDARIATAITEIAGRLREQFRTKFPADDSQQVAAMISEWIDQRLPDYETLRYEDQRSEEARSQAAALVAPVMTSYRTGTSKLADAGKPLSDEELALLKREREELVSRMHVTDKAARVAAYAGMICALYLLCGSYIFFVDDRRLLLDRWKLAMLLTVMVVTVTLGYFGLARSMAR